MHLLLLYAAFVTSGPVATPTTPQDHSLIAREIFVGDLPQNVKKPSASAILIALASAEKPQTFRNTLESQLLPSKLSHFIGEDVLKAKVSDITDTIHDQVGTNFILWNLQWIPTPFRTRITPWVKRRLVTLVDIYCHQKNHALPHTFKSKVTLYIVVKVSNDIQNMTLSVEWLVC